eukprot:13067249-Alexandrium_andersonii.AAC.1
MLMVAAPSDAMRAAVVTLQRVVRGWMVRSTGRHIAWQARAIRLGRFVPWDAGVRDAYPWAYALRIPPA